MEGRIEPLLPRFGIQGIGNDVRDRRGRQGAFEETLEKQKDGRKGKEDKPLSTRGDAPPRPNPPPKARSEQPAAPARQAENDGQAHVDILV